MRRKKENAALEINTGASVNILNKETFDLISCKSPVNLLPISLKLQSYSGELGK